MYQIVKNNLSSLQRKKKCMNGIQKVMYQAYIKTHKLHAKNKLSRLYKNAWIYFVEAYTKSQVMGKKLNCAGICHQG